MKRRTAVRVISFCVTAALIFAGFALKSRTETKSYRLQIQNGYSRSLEELLSGVNNIRLQLAVNFSNPFIVILQKITLPSVYFPRLKGDLCF